MPVASAREEVKEQLSSTLLLAHTSNASVGGLPLSGSLRSFALTADNDKLAITVNNVDARILLFNFI